MALFGIGTQTCGPRATALVHIIVAIIGRISLENYHMVRKLRLITIVRSLIINQERFDKYYSK